MDRLKPGIHLTLKVASVMGQWVDLDILHKFYPINKSKVWGWACGIVGCARCTFSGMRG